LGLETSQFNVSNSLMIWQELKLQTLKSSFGSLQISQPVKIQRIEQ